MLDLLQVQRGQEVGSTGRHVMTGSEGTRDTRRRDMSKCTGQNFLSHGVTWCYVVIAGEIATVHVHLDADGTEAHVANEVLGRGIT